MNIISFRKYCIYIHGISIHVGNTLCAFVVLSADTCDIERIYSGDNYRACQEIIMLHGVYSGMKHVGLI